MLLCANKIRSSTILPTVTFYIGKTDITKFIVLFYQISYDYFQFRQKVWDVSVLCQYDWIDFYFLKLLHQLNKRLLLIPIFWRAAVNELQLLIFLTSSRSLLFGVLLKIIPLNSLRTFLYHNHNLNNYWEGGIKPFGRDVLVVD